MNPTRPPHLPYLSPRAVPPTPARPRRSSRTPTLLNDISNVAVPVRLAYRVDKVHKENGAEEGPQDNSGDSAVRDARAGWDGVGGLARRE